MYETTTYFGNLNEVIDFSNLLYYALSASNISEFFDYVYNILDSDTTEVNEATFNIAIDTFYWYLHEVFLADFFFKQKQDLYDYLDVSIQGDLVCLSISTV